MMRRLCRWPVFVHRLAASPLAEAMAAVTDHGAEAAGQLLLSSASLERFFEEGYVCLEGIMDAEHCEAVKRDIDALMLRSERDEPGGPSRRAVHVAEMPTLGALTVFEPVVRCVGQLMEAASEQAPEAGGLGTFSFHHQHAARLDAGAGPADWHMDYEQVGRDKGARSRFSSGPTLHCGSSGAVPICTQLPAHSPLRRGSSRRSTASY